VIIQHEMAGAGAQDSEFYVRYYVGHKGKVGCMPTIPSLLRLMFFSCKMTKSAPPCLLPADALSSDSLGMNF
jgi:hypothetical protein